jgi:hypothetical protein
MKRTDKIVDKNNPTTEEKEANKPRVRSEEQQQQARRESTDTK